VHVLIVPKEMQGLNMLSNATPENVPILGSLMYAASVIAKQEGLENGYRIVINNGKDGCEQFLNILSLLY
jgi:diadenosine tetraphosphate (Ap4A) HIT family hydrolase